MPGDGAASAAGTLDAAPHPNGVRRLDTLILDTPAPLGVRSAGIAARLGIVPGGGDAGQRLTLVLDGGVQRRRLEPHGALPLTIVL